MINDEIRLAQMPLILISVHIHQKYPKSWLWRCVLKFIFIFPASTTKKSNFVIMAKKTDINITGKELFGIVFGVAIIFATLSGWIVFKLMRGYYPFQGQYQKRQKEPTTQAEDESFRFINLDRDLPEPISERSLLREWENLSVSIKNHVTDSYHRDYIGRDYHIDNSSSLAYLEPFQLEDSRSRCPALRQCIGKFILDRIQPGGNPDDTFLPSKLVSIVHSMPIKASESSPRTLFLIAVWPIRVLTFSPKLLRLLWQGGESLPTSS